jgi:hypothetical protein
MARSDAAINIDWTSPLSPVEGIQQSVSVNKTAPSTYFATGRARNGACCHSLCHSVSALVSNLMVECPSRTGWSSNP